jgi:hypothetical protein
MRVHIILVNGSRVTLDQACRKLKELDEKCIHDVASVNVAETTYREI